MKTVLANSLLNNVRMQMVNGNGCLNRTQPHRSDFERCVR